MTAQAIASNGQAGKVIDDEKRLNSAQSQNGDNSKATSKATSVSSHEAMEEPRRTMSGIKQFFAFSSFLSTVFLFVLDNTICKAYNVFNMKWLFTMCIILFEAGSAICSAAPNMPTLIVGRVIAGVGGCGIYAGALNYVTVLTASHERPLNLAGITCVWGAA
ncbi:putative HC-toxin efflux carrier TOXA [Tolypocladium ophioglossoides CBS 100239]|uniref:Putative HC-toxin efflux carrier TOXA n=1 Tax=Tolypocladium ophioglossoides (strain CBS 100239) TaxID=1163406 RepID=A0A0L0MZB2_TOLOC|nr:putative HC-toxin efflux carrier TOXA [Tolypocladium ophioglossoides CBS 100239]